MADVHGKILDDPGPIFFIFIHFAQIIGWRSLHFGLMHTLEILYHPLIMVTDQLLIRLSTVKEVTATFIQKLNIFSKSTEFRFGSHGYKSAISCELNL